MFKKALILGVIIPLVVYLGKLVLVAVSKIQPTEFKPVFAIFLLFKKLGDNF